MSEENRKKTAEKIKMARRYLRIGYRDLAELLGVSYSMMEKYMLGMNVLPYPQEKLLNLLISLKCGTYRTAFLEPDATMTSVYRNLVSNYMHPGESGGKIKIPRKKDYEPDDFVSQKRGDYYLSKYPRSSPFWGMTDEEVEEFKTNQKRVRKK